MKKLQLSTADFVKAADALTNESFTGDVHLSISEGLGEMDPFIGDQAPVFFTYTFYGHLYAAQMCAVKLFDTHSDAFTIPKFLQMSCIRKAEFKNVRTQNDVLDAIAEAGAMITTLRPTLEVLKRRRNRFLAHISPTLVFERERIDKDKKLTIPQIREVLLQGGKIVNRLLLLWNNSMNQLRETHTDDYKRVVSLMSKQLCAETKAQETEFAEHGITQRLPRPRDCE